MPILEIKPYSIAELSRMYEVSKKTLRKWLKPHETKIGDRIGHFYTAIQVQKIFEALGTPNRCTPVWLTIFLKWHCYLNLV